MATVKFPKIYGSKSSRSIPKKSDEIKKLNAPKTLDYLGFPARVRRLRQRIDGRVPNYSRIDSLEEENYSDSSASSDSSGSSRSIIEEDDIIIEFDLESNARMKAQMGLLPAQVRSYVPYTNRLGTRKFCCSFQQCNQSKSSITRCTMLQNNLRKKKLKSTREMGISKNFVDYLSQRSIGMIKNPVANIQKGFFTQETATKLQLKEHLIKLPIPPIDKIFCSKWLTDDQILVGTKCSKLLLHSLKFKTFDEIPMIGTNTFRNQPSGIHAMDINPSATMLCTSASTNIDAAIYELPSLTPVCIGSNSHKDLIFDLRWIDDQFFASVSRDNTLALWKFQKDSTPQIVNIDRKFCRLSDKLRALNYNRNREQVVTLSFNSRLHVFDIYTLQQAYTKKMERNVENVCIATNDDLSMYAIGSKCKVTLVDTRTLQTIQKINMDANVGTSVRSLSFQGDVITAGTGTGNILLYDVKAQKRLDFGLLKTSNTKIVSLESNSHYALPQHPWDKTAIYTHCYDSSGTRLFAAGGPLTSCSKGCYASIWCC